MKVQAIQLVRRAPKDGVSVLRIDNYYLCEATGTVPSADDSRWTLVNEGGKIPVPTAAAPYLWHKSITRMSDGSTLAPVIDFCGSLGKNGFDYDLVPSASTIVKKEDGTVTPSSVSCTLIRREADGTATVLKEMPDGYNIRVFQGYVRNYTLGELVEVGNLSAISFLLMYGTVVVERHDIRVISEGAQGVTGRGIQSQDYRFRAMATNTAPATPTSDTEWNLWYALANAGYSEEKPYLFRCVKTVYVDGTGVTTTEYTVDGPTVWGSKGDDAVTWEIQPDSGSMIDGKAYNLLFSIYKVVGSERTALTLTDIRSMGMQCIETGGVMIYTPALKKFTFAITKAVFGQEYTFGLKSSSGEMLCSYTWMVQKQGDKGDKGDDGKSALYIDCVPDSFTYPADNNGICVQSVTNTVTIKLMYGTTQVANYSVEVCSTDDSDWYTEDTFINAGGDVFVNTIERSGNDTVMSIWVGEAGYADDNAWVQVRMTTTIEGKEVSVTKQINCYANKEGARGYDGVIIRRREWEAGKEYRNDTEHKKAAADGNYYLDEVCVSDYNDGEGKSYICKQTHTSSSSNKPPQNGTSTYWTAMNSMSPIMTPFADITRAVIDYLQAKQITIEQNGTAYGAFGGGNYPLWFGGKTPAESAFKVNKKGVLTATGLIANEANISGAVRANTIGYDLAVPSPSTDYNCDGASNGVWKSGVLGIGSGHAAAIQVLSCNASVYILGQTIVREEYEDDWIAATGGTVAYILPEPSKVGKMSVDLYFRNSITDWDGYEQYIEHYLFVGSNIDIQSNAEIENGAYTNESYSWSGTPSYTLADLQSANTARITTNYYVRLNYKLQNNKETRCDLPKHIKVMSDGETWFLVQLE